MMFGIGGGCGAPTRPDVAVGPGNAALIKQVLENTWPDASTPTTQTLRNAVAWYARQNDAHPHYLMIATDGEPTCRAGNGMGNDSTAAIQAVAEAYAAGVPTFVVGIGTVPGAEATLAAMAAAGGEPNTTPGQPPYYLVSSSQDLVNILEKAALRITPCEYPLAADPPDPDRVIIQYSGGVIARDLAHQAGWDYSSDGKSVVFYGDACTTLRGGSVTSVQTIYGCPGDR
jgi:hypothetical protein